MRREQQRVFARLVCNQVAVGVTQHLEAESLQPLRQVLRNVLFFVGWAVDADQLAEVVDQPVSIYHLSPRESGGATLGSLYNT